ncbi:MAG: hypothetical protein ACYTGH_00750 [Planctomycetota bacterium]
MIGGGVAAVILLGLLGFLLFGESDEDRAKMHLARAQAMIADQKIDQAIDELDLILDSYGGTRTADRAAKLQDGLVTEQEIETIARQHRQGDLSTKEAKQQLYTYLSQLPEGRLLNKTQKLLDGLSTARNTRRTGDRSSSWTQTQQRVDQHVHRGNIKDAVSALNQFLNNRPSSADRRAAEATLTKLQSGSSNDQTEGREENPAAIQAALDQAQSHAQDGNLKEAWRALSEGFGSATNPASQKRLIDRMVALDRPLRQALSEYQKSCRKSIRSLSITALIDRVKELGQKANGSSWSNPLKAERARLLLLRDYRYALEKQVEIKLDEGFRVTLPGLPGLYALSMDMDENPVAKSAKGTTQSLGWNQINAETLWALNPSAICKNKERLGAALYFHHRGHRGYLRSYLQGLEKEPDGAQINAYLKAQESNRTPTAHYDFSDFSQGLHWISTQGEWDTTHQSLTATGDRSHALLQGRVLPLSGLRIRFDLKLNAGDGRLRLLLNSGDERQVTFELRRSSSSITVDKGGEKTEGKGTDADGPISLTIEKGMITAHAGSLELVSQSIDLADRMAVLQFQFDGLSGSLDNIQIEEEL